MIASLKLLTVTFVVTAIYDIILRLISEERVPMFDFIKGAPWMRSLKEYFERTTPLQAALVAGFVGAVTQFFIVLIRAPPARFELITTLSFLWISFVVSGLSGELMRASKLFPVLDDTMYHPKNLTRIQSILADASSGVVVNATLLFMIQVMKLAIV